MTCAERIRRIRLMDKMEKSNRTTTENGTMKYHDHECNVLIEATMKKRA